MANGIWYGSVIDQFGRGVNQATIRVTDPITEDLLGLFKDREGTLPIGNPFLTRENGAIKFFVRAGRIDVNAAKGADAFDFLDEIVVDDWGFVAAPVIAVTDIESDSVTISITLDATNRSYITSFTPRYKLDSASIWTSLATIPAAATTYTFDSILSAVTDYDFSLVGNTFFETTATSNTVSATTDPSTIPLLAVLSDTNAAAPRTKLYSMPAGVLTALSNLATDPGTFQKKPSFSPDGSLLAISRGASASNLLLYSNPQDGTTPTLISGQPNVAMGGNGNCCAFNAAGTFLAGGSTATPWLQVYSISGTTATKLTNPATLPAASVLAVAFSPDGNFLACATGTSPYVHIYSISGTTFTKLSNPATLPPSTVQGLAFSPDSSMLACAIPDTSPYVHIYSISGTTFTKLSNPATLPNPSPMACAFSPNGQFLALGLYDSPYINIYSISGTTFTKLSNPATTPSGRCWSVAFNSDSSLLAASSESTPFVAVYDISGTTFTKKTNPATLPVAASRGVAFSP